MTPMQPSVDLGQVFEQYRNVYIGFSGGKDSTAVVELCEPWGDQVTLLSVDPGHSFPHMTDRIEQYGKRFKLQWIKSDQAAHWARSGLPAQVVPVANVDVFGRGVHIEPKMQAWQACCLNLISGPWTQFLRSQPDAVLLHGQRLTEIAPGYYPSPDMFVQGGKIAGFTNYAPIRDWTEADVLAFLSDRGVELPIQYQYGTGDFSLDCANCPAMLSNKMRVKFMQAHYPDLLATALDHLRVTHAAATEANNRVGDAILSATARHLPSGLSAVQR